MILLLQDYITISAQKRPGSIAIHEGERSITYGELNLYTNKFSRYLASRGVSRQDKVALFIPKSIASFKAMISVLKADAIYVPLNVQVPTKRNTYIAEHSQCDFLICDKSVKSEALLIAKSVKARSLAVIVIDEVNLDNISEASIIYHNTPSDLAYVLYTSGSTGFPKGVMIRHRNVVNYTEWAVKYFQISFSDRMSNHPGIHFDLSVFDIFPAFRSGASLHLVPQDVAMFPIKIVEFIESNKLTIWNSVPSLYTFMARTNVLDSKRLTSLRVLTFNGEVMPTSTVISWMSACPQARCVNQYGPTETTCGSFFYEIVGIPSDATIPLPIGRPIANTEFWVLKDDGSKAEVNEAGELYIAGAGVGHGYLFDQEKTDKSFIFNTLDPNAQEPIYRTGDLVKLRPDGNLDFLGRRDHQIKFMGYRVELGEIESALNSLDYVSTSAVIAVEHSVSTGTIIAAFVVLIDEINAHKIKKDVGMLIPHYMVPKVITVMQELPFNPNGKIDRNKLRELYMEKQ
nr:amino acid adenylation domain-containing protein [Cytophagales bacterium]